MGPITELVKKVDQVCPMPAAAQRVVVLASDPRARIEAVAEAIATDPALSAEVMKIANSAAFGRSRKISELEHAVSMIGLREIRSMAAAMAMLAAFASKGELALDFHDRAVLSGSIARVVAGRLPRVEKPEAFLCGLLSEIGAMACLALDSTGYTDVWTLAQDDAEERDRLEEERYGGTSRAIGGELLRRHDLPEHVAAAVEANPNDPENSALAKVTGYSRIASLLLVKAGAEGTVELSEALAQAAALTGLAVALEDLVEDSLKAAGTAIKVVRRHR